MAGFIPAIHVFAARAHHKIKTWMPGTRPGMTVFARLNASAESG
jgi:hypothetical protein